LFVTPPPPPPTTTTTLTITIIKLTTIITIPTPRKLKEGICYKNEGITEI
jgi:hypothetical protein